MRGAKENQSNMLCFLTPEDRVSEKHPIRKIKEEADEALGKLSPIFDRMYSETGRPSIPPERLLKAQLLIALYSIRSERQFCEQLDYNILFRWFLGMNMTEASFDATVFTKNRDRLMEQEVAHKFLKEVVEQSRKKGLISEEHFTADGTLIEAWASMKSFVKKDEKEQKKDDNDPGNPSVDFHGEKRKNETHESKTDPEARLMRKGKGKEAKLCFSGTFLMENRNGLCVDVKISSAMKQAEKEDALELIRREHRRGKKKMKTIGGDKGFCERKFVKEVRGLKVKPHIAKIEKWKIPGLDGRTLISKGYKISQVIRKRIEEIIGWCKTVGGYRKTKLKGIRRNQEQACIVIAAYDLLRMSNLTGNM